MKYLKIVFASMFLFPLNTFAGDVFTLKNKFKYDNYKMEFTGKAVNGITHDNVISQAKIPDWEFIPSSVDGYYNICIPTMSLCLYSVNDDLKTGYIQNDDYSKWRLEQLPYNFADGKIYYKIINKVNKKIHWEYNKPSVIIDSLATSGWESAFFRRDQISQPLTYVYEKTFTNGVSTNGVVSSITQKSVPSDKDLYVLITLTGDFSSTSGNAAVVYLDGEWFGYFKGMSENTCGNKPYSVMVKIPREKANRYLSDGNIDIFVQNAFRTISCNGSHKLEFSFQPTTTVNNNGKLSYPFDENKNFYVCQGYNGPVTHKGKNQYAFDLTIKDDEYGETACYGKLPNGASKETDGQAIRAPASGVISYIGTDTICLNIEEGIYQGHSIELGHANSFMVVKNQRVARDEKLGVVQSPTLGGGIFSHLHMALFSNRNCGSGTNFDKSGVNIPFNNAFNGKAMPAGTIVFQEGVSFDISNNWRKAALRK